MCFKNQWIWDREQNHMISNWCAQVSAGAKFAGVRRTKRFSRNVANFKLPNLVMPFAIDLNCLFLVIQLNFMYVVIWSSMSSYLRRRLSSNLIMWWIESFSWHPSSIIADKIYVEGSEKHSNSISSPNLVSKRLCKQIFRSFNGKASFWRGLTQI